MKTTVEITDSLLEEAKGVARNRGLTLRQLIEDGLRESLRRQRPRSPRFHLRDGSFRGEGLQDNSTWAQVRSVIYEGRGE